MTDLLLSNDALDRLRSAAKRVRNPGARWLEKPGRHKQRNFNAVTGDGQSTASTSGRTWMMIATFRVAWRWRGGKPLSLVRYNGASHVHGKIRYACHIHLATVEALAAGRKVDSHAEGTERYKTVEGALACLIEDCGIEGLSANRDERDLFDGA